jgi:dihydroorotate dehydrogenase (NAD+) catalytic subunit
MTGFNAGFKIGNLEFKNTVLTASGTYGFGLEFARFIEVGRLGGIATKGLSLKPKMGNPGERLYETPAGMLNSIGLENPGVESFINDYLPEAAKLGTAIIANISGANLDEYGKMAEILDGQKDVSALEVNISCPNVKAGGIAFGTDIEMVRKVTSLVKSKTTKPVIMKLSPNVTDITQFALAAEEEGADAVSMINTLIGMAIDVNKRKPVLGNIVGGLSGPAIKPVALRMVYQTAQKVKIPIIGMGGISDTRDALEFLLAGASAIMTGTINFREPQRSLEIIDGIEKYCLDNGYNSVSEIVGLAWKEDKNVKNDSCS